MAPKRALRGFTLPELVTVIVIVAALAALALPRLNQQAQEEVYFAEQVKSAVRYAQKQAIAQRRSVHVVVSASEVRLCYDAGCASALRDLLSGNPYTLTKPSGLSLSGAPASFSFNGLGQPSAAAAISVGAKTISVAAETGYVTLS